MDWLTMFGWRVLKGIGLYLRIAADPLWEAIAHPRRFWRDKEAWLVYCGGVVIAAVFLWFLAELYLLTTPYPNQKLANKGALLTLLFGGHLCCAMVVFTQEWRHYRRFGVI